MRGDGPINRRGDFLLVVHGRCNHNVDFWLRDASFIPRLRARLNVGDQRKLIRRWGSQFDNRDADRHRTLLLAT